MRVDSAQVVPSTSAPSTAAAGGGKSLGHIHPGGVAAMPERTAVLSTPQRQRQLHASAEAVARSPSVPTPGVTDLNANVDLTTPLVQMPQPVHTSHLGSSPGGLTAPHAQLHGTQTPTEISKSISPQETPAHVPTSAAPLHATLIQPGAASFSVQDQAVDGSPCDIRHRGETAAQPSEINEPTQRSAQSGGINSITDQAASSPVPTRVVTTKVYEQVETMAHLRPQQQEPQGMLQEEDLLQQQQQPQGMPAQVRQLEGCTQPPQVQHGIVESYESGNPHKPPLASVLPGDLKGFITPMDVQQQQLLLAQLSPPRLLPPGLNPQPGTAAAVPIHPPAADAGEEKSTAAAADGPGKASNRGRAGHNRGSKTSQPDKQGLK